MRWGLTAVGMAWLAAGCSGGDDPSPFAESRTPTQIGERFLSPEGWAWGYLQLGDAPAQRYGVASGAGAAAGQLLILPDQGECAEDWFETVRDFNRRGFTVWLLEGVGQGGSGRLTRRRDLGHVESFDGDVAAARAMVSMVIRPTPRAPLVVLGQGVGGAIAARAVAGDAAAAGLIISGGSADAGGPSRREVAMLRRIGLGRWRAIDLRPPGGDPWRTAAAGRWRRFNPDLRMTGPSLDRLAAERDNSTLARRSMTAITVPVLTIDPGVVAPELGADAVRRPWLDAIAAFARARVGEARRP